MSDVKIHSVGMSHSANVLKHMTFNHFYLLVLYLQRPNNIPQRANMWLLGGRNLEADRITARPESLRLIFPFSELLQ